MAYRGNMFKHMDYNKHHNKGIKYYKPYNTVSYKMVIVRLVMIVMDIISIIMGIISMIGG